MPASGPADYRCPVHHDAERPLATAAAPTPGTAAAHDGRLGSGAEPTGEAPWWQRAVVYHVYPRSFADTDGDGVGDLPGVRAHLDHLAWLGVDTLWLSPFYPSPMVDFGYDVSDYCGVDPRLGTLDDFDALVADAHALGIRVLVDWVPNHTSDQHPWFVESRAGRESRRRGWYVWRDGRPDGQPPNNWVSAFDPDSPAWSYDAASDQWFLHLFTPNQPDLNWDEPAVEQAMHDVLRFWLDRGVDGFRADVVHAIGKDPGLPDDPPEVAGLPHAVLNDVAPTHERLRAVRRLLDAYPGDRVIVGEVYLLETARVARYYGHGDELHLAFNFPPLLAPWDARPWRTCIAAVEDELGPREAWPTWVLANHDNPRPRTRYDRAAAAAGEDLATRSRRSEARVRAAAVLLLALRGTPFVYQGEELGLADADVPADARVDPGGRDGCRAPLPWDASLDHGWPSADGSPPWLPFPADAAARNVASQRADPGSILNLYRRTLALRRSSTVLASGAERLVDAPSGVVAVRRGEGPGAWTVLVNFTGAPLAVPVDGPAGRPVVLLASDGAGEGSPYSGVLAGDQAVVLAPPVGATEASPDE